MPTIINEAGIEQHVDDVAYRRLQSQVDSGQRDQVLTLSDDGQAHVRLWDCIDQSWTGALPPETYAIYLRKQVLKCGACNYCTIWSTGGTTVKAHVENVREQVELHLGAELSSPNTDNGEPNQVCTGCGFHFKVGSARKHLSTIREMGALHEMGVEALLLHRFALVPSEPIVVWHDQVAKGLDVRPVESIAPTRKRQRRRRKGRGTRSD
jgi:hypothetical protein